MTAIRLLVVADQQGQIIAGQVLGALIASTGADELPRVTMVAGEGQVRHVVDMPRELMQRGRLALEKLTEYRLDSSGQEPRLIRLDQQAS